MNAHVTSFEEIRAQVPASALKPLMELVKQLGGRLLHAEDEECVISPPLSEVVRIGRLLRGARVRKGLTQAALAQEIGVPQSHISAYEKNRRPIPREKAELLAKVLETVPEHFLPRENA